MLRDSLVWKLTIWFLLLSLLPIGVIVLFVRQDVSDELVNLAKEDARSRASLLANGVSYSADDRQVQGLIADASNESQTAFLIGGDGAYIAHGEASKAGGLMSEDFSTQVVSRVLSQPSGVVVEEDTGRLVGFAAVPAGFTKAVLAVDESVVSAPMLRIERSALVQLTVSLLVINIAIGVAIWVVFRPIRRLTSAAKEVGAGNLDVRIDPEDMEGELEVLTNAFNDMTEQVRGAYEGLEQTVADRTEELRESEERLRTVVTSAPVVLFAIDRDGVFNLSEGQGLDALGLAPGEVVGRSAFEVYRDVPQIAEDIRRALAGEKLTSTVDVAGLTFESHYSPVSDDDGGVVGLIGVSTDITERRRAEEQGKDLVVLQERNRVAREIHDTLAQGFTGIVLQLEAAEQALDGSDGEVNNHLTRAKNLARESLQEARRSMWDLLPKSLEEHSLDAALHQAVDSWADDGGGTASFTLSGEMGELSADVQTALLRICQESLTNIRRHAQATEVSVALDLQADAAHLAVQDNGKGFDVDSVNAKGVDGGFGLDGMEQRARILGGKLSVHSQKGEGTLVVAKIPLG